MVVSSSAHAAAAAAATSARMAAATASAVVADIAVNAALALHIKKQESKVATATDMTLKAEHVTVMQFLLNQFFIEYNILLTDDHTQIHSMYDILFNGRTNRFWLSNDFKEHEDYGKVFYMDAESVRSAWAGRLKAHLHSSIQENGSYKEYDGATGKDVWRFVLLAAIGKMID